MTQAASATSGNRLADRVALVTGAASGIGAATAARFVAEGARVAAVDLDADRLATLAATLGDRCLPIAGDHTSNADNARAVAVCVERWGRLDVLYNNAGIGWTGAFEDCDDATLARVLDASLVGAWRMTQAALPHLIASAAQRPGVGAVLLFTSSGLGLHGRPKIAAYSVAKHGIVGLMRSLAQELGPRNVRVNAICPGLVDTPILRKATAQWGTTDDVLARFAEEAPLKRISAPEDIAAVAAFLASDDARMIHAHSLVVDGGTHGH